MTQNRSSHPSFIQVHKGKNLNIFIFKRCEFCLSRNTFFTFSIDPILSQTSYPLLCIGPQTDTWLRSLLELWGSVSRSISTNSFTLSATSPPLRWSHMPAAPDHSVRGTPFTATSHAVVPPSPGISHLLVSVGCTAWFFAHLSLGSLPPYSGRNASRFSPAFSQRAHPSLIASTITTGADSRSPSLELFFPDQPDYFPPTPQTPLSQSHTLHLLP